MFLPQSSSLDSVVVTGASGFVGRHLSDALEKTGCRVRRLARADRFDLLSDEIELDGADMVYHCAARTYVPDAWSDPVDFHRVNAHGTVRILDQCRRASVPMVYVSAYVYGEPESLPIPETAPIKVNNPYSFSKFMGEEACRFYAELYDIPVRIFRLFNVYGPGQASHFLIPHIVEQVANPSVKEIVLNDLSPRRDYVYIDDVIGALMLGPRLPRNATFNVGSGVSHSVEDIVQTAMRIAGVSKPYADRGTRRQNEVLDVVADISALKEAGSWSPSFTLEDGLRAIWNASQP